MSHFSKIKTKFRHREMLIQSLANLGYTIETDTTVQGHEGRHNVDILAKTAGGHGIGFVKAPDSTYDMVADWWGANGIGHRKIVRELQEKASAIQQEYAMKMVLNETEKEGYELVSRTEGEDGTIKLVVRRWS